MKEKSFFMLSVLPISLCVIFALNVNGQTGTKSKKEPEINDTAITFSSSNEALQKFQTSANPNSRVIILKKIGEGNKSARFSSSEEINSERSLIMSGLKDKYPNVVVEATKYIGLLMKTDMESDLISVYENATKTYPGYWEKIQLTILETLGKIGGVETSKLFKSILSAGQTSTLSSATLKASETLNDVSMIPYIEEFQNKMEGFVAAGRNRGDNPMLYSEFLADAELAKTVLASLAQKKGN